MTVHSQQPEIRALLRKLGIPAHRKGYKYLVIAIISYMQDDTQSLTKELYPYVARTAGNADWRSIEHDIRTVIQYAWVSRDTDEWDHYFVGTVRPPSNKVFISTIAEYLE